MEQALQIVFSLLAIIIALGGIYTITMQVGDTQKGANNDYSLNVLAKRCNDVCRSVDQGGHIALIEPGAGTRFFSKGDRICYRMGERVRCKPVVCNITRGTFLNLTGDLAQETYTTHDFRCGIERDENITIECKG